MWFEDLLGFKEESPEQVRALLTTNGEELVSSVNGKSFRYGILETPTLDELRQRTSQKADQHATVKVFEKVANVKQVHKDPENAGALFQVASQFNLLEMVSPDITPEKGVGIYQYDHTQGPACAMACGAGTVYRNYFAQVGDQIGQTESIQIDCLASVGEELGNINNSLWIMKNGYALPSSEGLRAINEKLSAAGEYQWDIYKSKLQIGIMWDTRVTLKGCEHLVSQAYCSALPVAYSNLPARDWEHFARLILEASYEATFHAAVLNAQRTGNHTVYLTLLGGGAFGNDPAWIIDSITKALIRFKDSGLSVVFVSYGGRNYLLKEFLNIIE